MSLIVDPASRMIPVMNRIDATFQDLRAGGRKGLMPYVCGGHPSLGATIEVLCGAADAGASLVEVGLPFSDPIADGPVIAAAMHEALESGVVPGGVLEAIGGVRGDIGVPLVAMVSYSIVHRIGVDSFCRQASACGIDGLIVPDLSVEEAPRLSEVAGSSGLVISLLVAPTTSAERAERIVSSCTGFVYLLSRVGITGGESGGPGAAIGANVARLRGMTDLPIACGFGISTASDVGMVVEHADAAIVGTALVRRMDDGGEEEAGARGLSFIRELSTGL